MWLCKYDLSKECDGKYNDCVDCVLDKIRAEIPKLVCCENEYRQALVKVADVIKCIDKHRVEVEPQESEGIEKEQGEDIVNICNNICDLVDEIIKTDKESEDKK